MANLFYNLQKRQNRFELEMNRKEVMELLLACQRWSSSDGVLSSVIEQIEQFIKHEKGE
jgi:hypothetical protein